MKGLLNDITRYIDMLHKIHSGYVVSFTKHYEIIVKTSRFTTTFDSYGHMIERKTR